MKKKSPKTKTYTITFDYDKGWYRYIDLSESKNSFQRLIAFDCGCRDDVTLEEYSNEGFYLDVDSAEKVVEALQKLIKSIRDKTTDGR